MNILILDDDRDLHRYYQAVCKALPNVKKVSTVANGREFEYALQRHKHHVIITDLQMAPTDGDIILLAHKDEIRGVPVVVLSCSDEIQKRADYMMDKGLNVVQCLSKPLKPDELYALIG